MLLFLINCSFFLSRVSGKEESPKTEVFEKGKYIKSFRRKLDSDIASARNLINLDMPRGPFPEIKFPWEQDIFPRRKMSKVSISNN